ncbi:MAG: GHKL domain-containing protein, partial [Lentisphaerae bacterium]|nr:GHKL domain-containing protein [Lentisphaerota bacterium]
DSLVHAGRLAAIGELASGVAHDIDNPLTVIVLSDEMILRLYKKAEQEGEHVPQEKICALANDVLRASASIRKLSNHLRNFSRGMSEKREYVDLYDSIGDALFMTNNKIVVNNVNVRTEVGKGQHFIYACPNHIEQVFINLVSNACDAMAQQEERQLLFTVTSQEHDGSDCWACRVADTGMGIPEPIRKEIFNSFFTTKEPGKGTGLGLSICRGIVAEYSGTIEIASSTGEGTVFTVLLPKADLESVVSDQ